MRGQRLQQKTRLKDDQLPGQRSGAKQTGLPKAFLYTAALTAVGVLGRTAFQFIPSVEPLTSLSILAGFLFGPIAGFASGASGFYLSNYLVWGGQGPWTVFQVLGAGLAGLAGGLFGKLGRGRKRLLAATTVGIALYEFTVTGLSAVLLAFNPAFVTLYFLTSLPFSLVHLASSLGFCILFCSILDQKPEGRHELEIFRRWHLGDRAGQPGNTSISFLRYRRIAGGWPDTGKHNSRRRPGQRVNGRYRG